MILILTEILVGAGSAVGNSSMALINPGAGICYLIQHCSIN